MCDNCYPQSWKPVEAKESSPVALSSDDKTWALSRAREAIKDGLHPAVFHQLSSPRLFSPISSASSAMSAPLTLYLAESGLNWMKLVVVMEELGLSYNEVILDFAKEEHKTEEYRKLNPNGRIPTLVDHSNNDEVVWESNAILKYIAERYDTEKKLLVTEDKEKADLDTWLFYQASHQGPTFGQAQWFMFYHTERIPSVIIRFQNEIKRIFGVLNDALSKKEWLVGNKCTIADLAFIKYNDYAIHHLLPENFNVEREFPHLAAWHAKLMARPAVQYAFKHMDELDVGRERQHVTGMTHSAFAQSAVGIARRGIAAQAAKGEILSTA